MKKAKRSLIIVALLIIYLIVSQIFDFHIPCPIKLITGFYCPGCGITRLLYSAIKLDFYQAYRYNPLLFILLPFGIGLYINNIYSLVKGKTPFYKKIPEIVLYVSIIVLIAYGIIRNIFPYFAPTEI